ncbi:MAG: zinc metallopeptidase [Dysgonamonadaceae bacterium]|jgi:Zn-dependent membrane protease YugP|nr:zinc metallopeptidase [Dysgonamonadaceae bacterium]
MNVYLFLLIGIGVLGWIVQWNLNRKFKLYSQMLLNNGMTGRDVAERMLSENGISDVTVRFTGGTLTDHYNPSDKTINLSESVYAGDNVAAAAVAAHETGHAIQHAYAYAPLKMRSALVPLVSFSGRWVTWLILGGMVLLGMGQVFFGQTVAVVGIVLYGLITLFSFITLPVEINASQRALAWLSSAGITNSHNDEAARDALRSAAYTYVVAALGALANLLYYVWLFFGRRD